jgi:SEC-C motif-containing protein
MRSRYSAHALGLIDYLMATWEARGVDREAIARWARESEWLGLEIVATERGGSGDSDGIVEFRARYRDKRSATHVHHERSRFRRRDERWVYVDGETPAARPVQRAATVGRNDPCPCGSGKKYKRCCGAGV